MLRNSYNFYNYNLLKTIFDMVLPVALRTRVPAHSLTSLLAATARLPRRPILFFLPLGAGFSFFGGESERFGDLKRLI